MKYARIVNNTAVDVRTDSPEGYFTPDIAEQFISVPDEVEDGWLFTEGVWAAPPQPSPEPLPLPPPQVSPVQFKMLFTSMERVAIREARKTDPTVDDFFDLMEDPRLTYVDLALPSVQGALHYLAATSLITDERIPQILSGKVQ